MTKITFPNNPANTQVPVVHPNVPVKDPAIGNDLPLIGFSGAGWPLGGLSFGWPVLPGFGQPFGGYGGPVILFDLQMGFPFGGFPFAPPLFPGLFGETPVIAPLPDPNERTLGGIRDSEYVAATSQLDSTVDTLIERTKAGETGLLSAGILPGRTRDEFQKLLAALKNDPTDAAYKKLLDFMKAHDREIPDDMLADVVDLKTAVQSIRRYEDAEPEVTVAEDVSTDRFREAARNNADLMDRLTTLSAGTDFRDQVSLPFGIRFNPEKRTFDTLIDRMKKEPTLENYNSLVAFVKKQGEIPPEYLVQLKDLRQDIVDIEVFKNGAAATSEKLKKNAEAPPPPEPAPPAFPQPPFPVMGLEHIARGRFHIP